MKPKSLHFSWPTAIIPTNRNENKEKSLKNTQNQQEPEGGRSSSSDNTKKYPSDKGRADSIRKQYAAMKNTSSSTAFACTQAEISPEVIEAIKNRVNDGLFAWDVGRDAENSEGTVGLKTSHKMLALLMDGLYKHHFKNSFTLDAVPSDEMLKTVCKAALADSWYQEDATKIIEHFQPKAKETMKLLYEDFNELPHLRDILPEHRWHMLVDQKKLDMLKAHGIDVNNPMLAFILEGGGEESYANKRAHGRIAVAKNINTPISLNMLKSVGNINCGTGFSPEDKTEYGDSFYTKNGLEALADFMLHQKKNYGITTAAQIGDEIFFMIPNKRHVCVTNIKGKEVTDTNSLEALMKQSKSIKGNLRERLQSFKGNLRGRLQANEGNLRELPQSNEGNLRELPQSNEGAIFKKHLLKAAEENGLQDDSLVEVRHYRYKTPHETLEKTLDSTLSKYHSAASNALSHKEKVSASAQLFFDLLHIHAMKDGNFRLSEDVMNISLGQQGEGISVFYDPKSSSGVSPDQLVEKIEDGQKRCRSWTQP